jgi:hypothetical protein
MMFSDHICECGKCHEFTQIATKTDKRRGQKAGEPMRFIAGHNSMVSLNKLQTVDTSPAELDELKIRALRCLGDLEAAKVLDDRLRFLESQYKRNYVERGFILLEMEERVLWKLLTDAETGQPYASFERWVVGAATHSRSDCFESLRAVKQLRDIPREQLLEIPRKNIGVLSQLSTQVRKDPEVIKAAQTGSKADFIGHLQTAYPDQHVEQESKMTTHPTVSQRKVIDLACETAAWVYGSGDRESALEAMATFFLDGDCEREGFEVYSNRRAYQTAQARGEVA